MRSVMKPDLISVFMLKAVLDLRLDDWEDEGRSIAIMHIQRCLSKQHAGTSRVYRTMSTMSSLTLIYK